LASKPLNDCGTTAAERTSSGFEVGWNFQTISTLR